MLRKSAVLVSITYSRGGFSNNLYAGPCSMADSDGTAYLVLDFSRNLQTRNKRENNSYTDACELAEEHSDLRTIQIDSGLVRKFMEFVRARKIDRENWRLQIGLGDKGTFTYSILRGKPCNGDVLIELRPIRVA